MPPELTVQESLELFAGYYPKPRSVSETVALVGLTEQRDKRAGHLSGGQQRRLDMAIALVGDPDLVFLDEPTTGFDPGARREAWEAIAALRDVGGKTVLRPRITWTRPRGSPTAWRSWPAARSSPRGRRARSGAPNP